MHLGGVTVAQRRTNGPRTFTDLMVESLDPVTMTLSSYCRQSTEPVCPWRVLVHSSVSLSQIWTVGGGGENTKCDFLLREMGTGQYNGQDRK